MKKLKTIAEFYENYGSILSQFNAVEEYKKFKSYFDSADCCVRMNYGQAVLRPTLNYKVTIGDKTGYELGVSKMAKCVLDSNIYRYNTLISSMYDDYEPYENYNMIETQRHNDITDTAGAVNSTVNSGTRHSVNDSTVDAMQRKETQNIGERRDTVSHSTNDNTSSNKAPFDSTRQHPTTWDDKNVIESGSDTQGAQTNVTTTDTPQQHSTSDTRVDATVDSTQSTDSNNTVNEGGYTLTRRGNIGVTTTQQMLQSSRDLAQFNLAEIIARDIVESICIQIWAGGMC